MRAELKKAVSLIICAALAVLLVFTSLVVTSPQPSAYADEHGEVVAGGDCLKHTNGNRWIWIRWNLYEDGFMSADLEQPYNPEKDESFDEYKGQISRIEVIVPGRYSSNLLWGFSDCPNLVSVSALDSGYPAYVVDGAFSGCPNLTTVELPSFVEIRDGAFSECTSLSQVNAPAATLIGSNAFKGCSSLQTIDLSPVNKLGSSAFENCTRLRSVAMAGSVPSGSYINESAFKNCTSLRSFSIPSGITSVSDSTFDGCTRLASVDIPETVTSISQYAFRGCKALSQADLPNGLNSIGQYAFAGCEALASVELPAGITAVRQHAFDGSGITQATIPDSLTSLDSYAFANCGKLASVSLPSTLKSIPTSAFENGVQLASIDLSHVSAISAKAFSGCTSLEALRFGDALTTLGANAFENCSGVTEIHFDGDAPNINASAFAGVTANCYYPADNDTWDETYFQDYGGNLTWYAEGADLADCTLELAQTQATYAGTFPDLAASVKTRFGGAIDPAAYAVCAYRDAACTSALQAGDAAGVGTYYVRAEGVSGAAVTPCEQVQVVPAQLVATYAGERIDYGTVPSLPVQVEGFVNGESAATAAGYVAPQLPAPASLQPGRSYTLTPYAGSADNYTFTYVAGDLVVNPYTVAVPVAASGIVYDGRDHVGVSGATGYSLSGTTHATAAGDYSAYATPNAGYAWPDGSAEQIEIPWSIARAQLVAAFVDETVARNVSPKLAVAVSGFVNGETPETASGFAMPTASIPVDAQPGFSYTASVAGGAADNYSFSYQNGTVTILDTAAGKAPVATTHFTFDGNEKRPVEESDEYVLSGDVTAVNAGSYEVIAVPASGFTWSDGTTEAIRIPWTIDKAEIGFAFAPPSIVLDYGATQTVGYTGSLAIVNMDLSGGDGIVEASYDWQVYELTVRAKKQGTTTITATVPETTNFKSATATLTVTVNACTHDWDAGRITMEPTIGAEGVRTYTCKIDAAHSKTEPVDRVNPSPLNKAIAEAQKADSGVTVTDDPSGLAHGAKYVSSVEAARLSDALDEARAVANNADSTQRDVDAAKTAIERAAAAYKSAVRQHVVYHTVTFWDDEVLLSTQQVVHGQSAIEPSVSPRAGFTFGGWSADASKVLYDMDLSVCWIRDMYTITWVDDGGVVLETGRWAYGTLPSYSGTTPTKAKTAQYSYTFSGWSPAVAKATKDATYTAQFKATVNKYTVTFKDGYTSKDPKVQTVEYGKAATAPATPARTGYIFDGWDKAFSKITGNLTVTAKWKAVDKSKLKAAQDGAMAAAKGVPASDAVNGKDLPNATKYTTSKEKKALDDAVAAAKKVYDNKSATQTQVDAAAKKLSDAVAAYKKAVKVSIAEYTITWKGDGGMVLATTKAAHGETPKYTGATPAKPKTAQYSYTFSGWSPAVAKATKDATYTAQFKATLNKYTVTFKDGYSGTVLKAKEVGYGKAATAPAAPTRAGYEFAGWDKAFNKITGALTVTAKWIAKPLVDSTPAPTPNQDPTPAPAPTPDPSHSPSAKPVTTAVSLSKAVIAAIPGQAWTGKAVTPKPKVTYSGKTLKEGADYTLSYKNNVNAGTATVTATGKGAYTGTKSATFKVVKAPAVWVRLAGAGSLDTMRAIVCDANGWRDGCGGTVVLATWESYYDALSASGVAGAEGAPVLMTRAASLSPQTSAELSRIRPSKVVVAGGVSAVPEAVVAQVRALLPAARVVRIAGANARGTAVALATHPDYVGRWSDTAILATQTSYKDALSAAPVAYAKRMPVFLVASKDTVDASTIAAMRKCGVRKVVMVGGELVVGPAVESRLRQAGFATERRAGAGSVATSRAVARWGVSLGMGADRMAVATRDGFRDALSGAALCGKNNSVLVLAADDDRSSAAVPRENRARIARAYVFGGKAAVSKETFAAFEAATK